MGASGLANGGSSAIGTRIEAPRRSGCGKGLSPPSSGKIFRFWISNRRILVRTGCFVDALSSPKAGLNAVLA